jgi:phospholipid/cholesterol/gamma-HCH transport system substrate-binding protein
MITKAQKIKLIVFVFGAVLLGLGMFVLFVQQRLFQSTSTFYVRVPGSVSGVEEGATVTVRGVRVGDVEEIQLYADDFQSVRLKLSIPSDTPIMKDARATLSFQGLSGQKFIDISGAGQDRTPLAPGSYIPYEASTLERVTDEASNLIAQAGGLLGTTNELIKHVADVTSRLDVEKLDALLTSTQHTVEQFDAAGAELHGLIRDARAPVQRALDSADAAFKGANGVTEDASKVMSNVNELVTQLNGVVRQNEDQLRAITYNLREATQSFKYLGQELRQRPSRLLIGEAPAERKLP